MKEAHIVAPKLEVPPILRGIKTLKLPVKVPKYYKRRIRQIKRGLI